MGKKKKSLQEKKISDLRRALAQARQVANSKPSENRSTFSYIPTHTPSPIATAFKTEHGILRQDIFKITLLTIAILTSQFILLFLLKQHLVSIPGISY